MRASPIDVCVGTLFPLLSLLEGSEGTDLVRYMCSCSPVTKKNPHPMVSVTLLLPCPVACPTRKTGGYAGIPLVRSRQRQGSGHGAVELRVGVSHQREPGVVRIKLLPRQPTYLSLSPQQLKKSECSFIKKRELPEARRMCMAECRPTRRNTGLLHVALCAAVIITLSFRLREVPVRYLLLRPPPLSAAASVR